MSTLPDNEFDLEKLFLPAWAQEQPSSVKYAKYEVEKTAPKGAATAAGPDLLGAMVRPVPDAMAIAPDTTGAGLLIAKRDRKD